MRRIVLNINGFEQESFFDENTLDEVLIPIIEKLEKNDRKRTVVFVAAPPGAGKSTFVSCLEVLGRERGYNNIQAVGIDGFHYPNEYLKNHYAFVNGERTILSDVKGCPETYNIDYLLEKLKALKSGNVKWPYYDRNIHDVIKDAVDVEKEIILVEGNWLLLDEDKWRDLKRYADYTIMINAVSEQLKTRLINRKLRGGLTLEEAVSFC